MSVFVLVVIGSIVLAVIGFLMNRSRRGQGNSDHFGTYHDTHGGTSTHHSDGDVGGRDVSHDGGGYDGGGDAGGGDSGGGGGDGGGSE